jgi:hypothetical protein
MQSSNISNTAVPVNVTFSYSDRIGIVYHLMGGTLDDKHVLVSIANVNGMKITTAYECDDSSGSGTFKETLSQITTDDAEELLNQMGYVIRSNHDS